MRKLASIQKVNAVEPIEGADAIERIRVLGWYVVVKKGEYKVGDLCIYVEIDSLLPNLPTYSFLKGCQRSDGTYRIKTVKLRGQVSQGICFPLYILFDENNLADHCKDWDWHRALALPDEDLIGSDLTKELGIEKYEPPIPACLAGEAKGTRPGDIPRTDEERVQKLEHVIARHRGLEVYAAEKLDGSSTSVYLKDDFGVCSRELDLRETDDNTFWQTVRKLDIETKLRSFSQARGGKSFSLQGELVGPGIQKNKLKLKEHMLYFFNVLNITDGRFLDLDEMLEALNEMNLKPVPIVAKFVLDHSIDQLVEMATRKSVVCPDAEAEGLVIRPLKEMIDPDLGRLSFKAINPKFLLKHEDA